MKKIFILIVVVISLLSFGCKKDNIQKQVEDNESKDNITVEKTDMEQFKKSLSIFKNPQYDMLYKLIEKGGINAELEEDVTIAYPSHAKRLLNNEEQVTIKKGATPLGIAALFCTPSLVNDLITKGADLKTKINGNDISAVIIQCGEAEQAGMFENYLKAVRKYERDNPETYENKPELYAANAIINITGEDGKGKTILNYAVEHKLNDAIPIILKYAGGINFVNKNDTLPIVTALEYGNFEAAKLFFEKTGSLFAQMDTSDGKISLIDYLFYNAMDEQIKKLDIPVNIFFKSLLDGYKKDADGIANIRNLIKDGSLKNVTQEAITTKNGEIPSGYTVAHIAATMEYNALLKGMAFYNDETDILNMQEVNNGDTPLHIAVRKGNLSTAKILLEGGAYIDKKNNQNLTPLDVAITEYSGKNQTAIVKLLLTSAGKTTNNYEISIDDNTIEHYINIKAVNDVFTKYDNEYRAFALSQLNIYTEKYLGPQLARILQGGIDNQLPFSIFNYDVVTFPKGTTPLIAASLMCDDRVITYLILANADTSIRINGENDLKYDAYDFADRIAGCKNDIKQLLKNPTSVKADIEKNINSDKNNTQNTNTVLDETLENNDEPYAADTGDIIDDNKTNNDNDVDVDLILE